MYNVTKMRIRVFLTAKAKKQGGCFDEKKQKDTYVDFTDIGFWN